jgi:catalase (peroxidase I)
MLGGLRVLNGNQTYSESRLFTKRLDILSDDFFVNEFVKAWTKVMEFDLFDLT